jgi:hypothetical protein
MITKLLAEAYHYDIELWTESGKLRYRAQTGALTPELKQQLVENKEALIKRLGQNRIATEKEWTVFDHGEAYNKRTGGRSEVFMFRNEDDTFMVWRGSWREGQASPMYEKTIADHVTFDEALKRVENYINWSANKSGRRKAG